MNMADNITISVKEEAFSDLPPKLKKVDKLIIGVGNGYTSENKDMRYIKLFFENNPSQTTKTLSHTKPLRTKNIKDVLKQLRTILSQGLYSIDNDLVYETDGINIKDKKAVKDFFSTRKR